MADKKKKYTFNTKLYECCAHNDDIRPMMKCVHFENGYAYASDGGVCIKQSLSFQSILLPEELDGKSMHKDNYKAVMAFEIAECTDTGIECKNADGQAAFFEYYTPRNGEKIPDFEAILKPKKGITNLSFIGYHADRFSKLMKALYAPEGNIRLQFTGIDTGILIDVVGLDEQQAVIMPTILNSTIF